MDDTTKDLIPRNAVEYCLRKETVSTNPDEYEAHEKFIAFMGDPEISEFGKWMHSNGFNCALTTVKCDLDKIPSAQPERLTDDDFETIRIHLDAFKEKLCNQHRWAEAEEYQRIIDRLMAFASAQSDYTEMKQEFLRMASYIDVLLECSDEQKETLMGFISRLAEYMPWTERD